MEKDLKELMQLKDVDPKEASPLALAFLGDGIYELIIRTLLFSEEDHSVQILHQRTSRLVQASAQSAMMRSIQDELTEEERGVYKRGRNARSVSVAKNQSVTDYRRATGFEALMGYLYLKKEYSRMLSLIQLGLSSIWEEEPA